MVINDYKIKSLTPDISLCSNCRIILMYGSYNFYFIYYLWEWFYEIWQKYLNKTFLKTQESEYIRNCNVFVIDKITVL